MEIDRAKPNNPTPPSENVAGIPTDVTFFITHVALLIADN